MKDMKMKDWRMLPDMGSEFLIQAGTKYNYKLAGKPYLERDLACGTAPWRGFESY